MKLIKKNKDVKSILTNYWKSWDTMESKFAKKFNKELKKLIIIELSENFKSKLGDTFTVSFRIDAILKGLERLNNGYLDSVTKKAFRDAGIDYNRIIANRAESEAIKELKKHLDKLLSNLRNKLESENIYGTEEENFRFLANSLIVQYENEIKQRDIARTMIKAETEITKKYVWSADDDLKRIWLSQRDGAVRLSHQLADGQGEDELGFFYLGVIKTPYPAGSGHIEEDANCRCVTLPLHQKNYTAFKKLVKRMQ